RAPRARRADGHRPPDRRGSAPDRRAGGRAFALALLADRRARPAREAGLRRPLGGVRKITAQLLDESGCVAVGDEQPAPPRALERDDDRRAAAVERGEVLPYRAAVRAERDDAGNA